MAGTTTSNEVAVAAVTVAGVVLNNTVLLAGVGSNFVPVIVTLVPAGPDAGAIAVTASTGCGVGSGLSSLSHAVKPATRPVRRSNEYSLFFKLIIVNSSLFAIGWF
ncbi:hypothetical protein D3C87_1624720 [compost metagenome]